MVNEMKKNPKIIILGVGVVFVVAMGLYRFGPKPAPTVLPEVAGSSSSVAMPAAPENTFKVPEKSKVSESIQAVAERVVALAPNQEEAYSQLVVAKSLRIQDLKSKQAEKAAATMKAEYDAAYWTQKRARIGAALDNELKTPDKEADVQRGTAQVMTPTYPMSSQVNEPAEKTNKKPELDDFGVRAIIQDETGYIARLSYKGKPISGGKAGQKLYGSVHVTSVTANAVVLTQGEAVQTLYLN